MKTRDTHLLFYLNFFHFFIPAIVLIIVTIQSQLTGQVILTEVMFDADTLESHNEFVEIYNLGEQSVTLTQWWLGDGNELDLLIDAGFGLILHPQQFALILDPSYFENSTTYDSMIPENALILTIEDGSFGSYGWSNTVSEPVILVNSNGDTIQKYFYSLDNSPGFSDEKIILSEDNSEVNWENSRQFRGSPGTYNSVMALAIDLAIDSLWIDPAFPPPGSEFDLFCILINRGIEDILQIAVTLYHDLNFNFQLDPEETILQEQIAEELNYGATIQPSWTLPAMPAGNQQLGVLATVVGDTHSENNQAHLALRIDYPESPLVINEIMYRPLTDRPEWVEMYNKSNSSLDLTNWYFADARDTIMMTKDEKWIAPASFVVLCEDSSLMEDFGLTVDALIVSASLPSLNNDYDDIKLLSFSKHLVDRVIYSDSWMRRETGAGISLERINPDISSSLPANWAASTAPAGATPGKKNSIYLDKPVDNKLLSINPNPFSPDADGFEDYAIFEYHLPFATGYISIDIFDSAGRRIRRLAVQQPVGSQGNFIWDGTDDGGRIGRMGIYIVLFRVTGTMGDSWEEIKKTLVLMKRR